MSKLFSRGIVIFLLCLFFPGQGFAEPVSRQSQNITLTSNTGVFESEAEVRVYYINQPLQDVLQEIHNKTGIQFKLKDRLKEVVVTADIRASNWESALDRLLRDYSTIKFWDDRLNLRRVHLLGEGNFQPVQAKIAKTIKRKKPAWKCFSLSGKRKC